MPDKRLRHHVNDFFDALESEYLDGRGESAEIPASMKAARAGLERLGDILDPVGKSCSETRDVPSTFQTGRHGSREQL